MAMRNCVSTYHNSDRTYRPGVALVIEVRAKIKNGKNNDRNQWTKFNKKIRMKKEGKRQKINENLTSS